MKQWIALQLVATVLPWSPQSHAALTFAVHFDAAVRREPCTGRLTIYLTRSGAHVSAQHDPADGFVEEDPQPIFGINVIALKAGQIATVDDSATAFPVPLSAMPAGKYRAQAVLDVHHDNSDWQREPGNLYSRTAMVEFKPDMAEPIAITLSERVGPEKFEESAGAKLVECKSRLLSTFRGHDVIMRAGVALPAHFDPGRSYATVYEVPGFGGDHTDAAQTAQSRANHHEGLLQNPDLRTLADNCFWIYLDPESGNGHTLFADSDNNGPCGRALVEELIPEMERRFHCIASPGGRIVTGHSSGGWSSLWLATEYPQTFGAVWSSSPDPVDFRRLELCDIYNADNMYSVNGKDLPSARFNGKETMTVRQENSMEQVLGPENDSGQQWDSWQGVWGHRSADGSIARLYDPITGKLNHAEANSYRRYDLADRLRKDPKRFVPLFRNDVHLVVGEADTYYLNEAVELLKHDLDELDPPGGKVEGYIKVVPNANHGTIYLSAERRHWPTEMLAFLKRGGHVIDPTTRPVTGE